MVRDVNWMRTKFPLFVLLTGIAVPASAQMLDLPPRPDIAMGGQAFAALIGALPPPPDPRRENLIYLQVLSGNVPNWMRRLALVSTNAVIHGANHTVSYYVTPDYLCIGADNDYFFQPITPMLAQRIANRFDCAMPTRKMVNDIWSQAPVKLTPAPLTPDAEMTTVPVFFQESGLIWDQRKTWLETYPLGALVAADKKDVVISCLIYTNFHKTTTPVVIYGWQNTNGVPIQPLYNGHSENWVDYSQGIRLVQEAITVDGATTSVSAVLTDPNYAALLSDETNYPGNVIPKPYYTVPPGD